MLCELGIAREVMVPDVRISSGESLWQTRIRLRNQLRFPTHSAQVITGADEASCAAAPLIAGIYHRAAHMKFNSTTFFIFRNLVRAHSSRFALLGLIICFKKCGLPCRI